MSQENFFHLADSVFDLDASESQIAEFERLIESHPDWMDNWIDQKTALQNSLGIEPIEATPNFTPSLSAMWQAQQIKNSLRYWMPSAFAAVAAAVGLFAILQVLGTPVQNPEFGRPEAEAKLGNSNSVTFPTLNEPLSR